MYYREADLAVALTGDWDKAREAVGVKAVARWAETGLGNDGLAKRLDFLARQSEMQPDAALTATLTHLDPQAPLHWRGRVLSQMDFVAKGEPIAFADAKLASSILGSAFWEWITDHSAAPWLGAIVKCCQERAAILGWSEIGAATPLQWWWLLAQPAALQNAAAKIRAAYVSSKDVRITSLFSKKELTVAEALLLGTAPLEQLLTVESAWEELVSLIMPTLSDLESRARQRPAMRKNLEAVEQELADILGLLRKQREELRPRQAHLPEPLGLLETTESVRLALHQAFTAHDLAIAAIREVRELVARGHVRRAVAEAVEVRQKTAVFSDLSLDFVAEAEVQYRQRRQRLVAVGVILAVGMIVTLIIIKFFIHLPPSSP